MSIQGKSVRSLARVLTAANGAEPIRFGFIAGENDPAVWEQLGFPRDVRAGDSIIPGGGGRVTVFNAQGREIVRRDLPMETRSVGVWSQWNDWHGHPHSGIQFREIERYPRDFIRAPSEQISVHESHLGLVFATDEVSPSQEPERALHLANLMLECFGEFDVIDVAVREVVGAHGRALQWQVFPRGQHPWERVKPIVDERIASFPEPDRRVIEDRLETITDARPDFFAAGNGGFNGYFVYGFTDRDIYVLESIHFGNATYVFRSDWEALSALTKNEIIQGDLAHARLIHDRNWRTQVFRLMRGG